MSKTLRPALTVYIVLVTLISAGLAAFDLASIGLWNGEWSPATLFALLLASVAAVRLVFQIQPGWFTAAGTVPHIASAFLLPPGLTALVGCAGAVSRAVSTRMPLERALFNIASVTLAADLAGHTAHVLGGMHLITAGSWLSPVAAATASIVYHVVLSLNVSVAIALDHRTSVWPLFRSKLGIDAFSEVGLGLTGAIVAVLFTVQPTWVPAIVPPAVLIFLARQSMTRADRRSRNLALTNTVGRAVAGTLDPQLAFSAITGREVRDTLKLDGMALVPLHDSSAFAPHVAATRDAPLLRSGIVAAVEKSDEMVAYSGDGPGGLSQVAREKDAEHLSAVGIPFRVGGDRVTGALIAWRWNDTSKPSPFTREDHLVLEMLADYAVVALETARLADEMAHISREAAAAEAMREVEALRELARLKDEFLGQVSHELRTPLTIIHGYAELVADEMVLQHTEIVRTAREIHTNSALMLRLVDDLLDTSRLESGRLNLNLEPIDLGPWLVRTATAFHESSLTHDLKLDVPESLPRVRADAARIGQVMNNLLSNATRYAPARTMIHVSAGCEDGQVVIRVRDEGVGVAVDEQSRIFEKFYRGKDGATLSVRGTGLGLAVAKSLVEAHHGHIGVESRPGQGATFWFSLPTQRGEAARPPLREVTYESDVKRPRAKRRPATNSRGDESEPAAIAV